MCRCRTLILGVALTVGGCASVPTLNYCQEIAYERDGNEIHIEADCRVPMDDGGTDWGDVIKGIMAGIMTGMMAM